MTDVEGWKPDPTGRHKLRFERDGVWTEHVTDTYGEIGTDPYTEPVPPSPAPRRNGRGKWWGIGIVALIVTGLISSSGSSNENSSPAKTTAAKVETVAKAAPVHVDTGRMSGGEYEQLHFVTEDFTNEGQQFLDKLGGKCNSLMQAGALADASDCIASAYKGLDDSAAYAHSVYSDLMAATAKTCRRRMRLLRSSLDQFASSMRVVERLGENLVADVSLAKAASDEMGATAKRYTARTLRAFADCSPT